MDYTKEQWLCCREEVNHLKRELNKMISARATLTDMGEIEIAKCRIRNLQEQYEKALHKLKEFKDEYEWKKSINREFASVD